MTCVDSLPVCVQIEFSVEKSTFHLLIDGTRVTDGHLPNSEGSSLDLHNPVYLGGDPLRKITKVCIKPHHYMTFYLTSMSQIDHFLFYLFSRRYTTFP